MTEVPPPRISPPVTRLQAIDRGADCSYSLVNVGGAP